MKPLICLTIAALFLCGCDDSQNLKDASAPPPANVVARDGIAVAIVVDVSGSMGESVNDTGGSRSPKFVIARRAVKALYTRSQDFSQKNPERVLEVSLYKFDDRPQQMISFAKPDAAGAAPTIETLQPTGGTAIGRAILQAKADLDATGLKEKHIVVVTDGENTNGPTPAEVAAEMANNPAKPSVYMVAFDINASIFQQVKSSGWMVYSAADATELQQALDVIFGEKILLEK